MATTINSGYLARPLDPAMKLPLRSPSNPQLLRSYSSSRYTEAIPYIMMKEKRTQKDQTQSDEDPNSMMYQLDEDTEPPALPSLQGNSSAKQKSKGSNSTPSTSISPETASKSRTLDLDLPGLNPSNSRSNSPMSQSARRGNPMRRRGMVNTSASPPISPRRTGLQGKSSFRRSQSFRLSRTSSPGEGHIHMDANLKSDGHIQRSSTDSSPEAMMAIRATAAQMIEKVAKTHEKSQNRLQNSVTDLPKSSSPPSTPPRRTEDTLPGLKKSVEVMSSASHLGFSTRTLGRMFDDVIDDEQDEGNYPMPPSLGARSVNQKKEEKRKPLNLRFTRRNSTGSEGSESSLSRLATYFKGHQREKEEAEEHGPRLGSTLLADRDHRFRKAVDQSINLMDASNGNYGASPERASTQRSCTPPRNRSSKASRRAAKKRGSVLDIMFGNGKNITSRGRAPNRQANNQQSMVDIKLEPGPTKLQPSISRSQMSLGKLTSSQDVGPSWNEDKKTMWHWLCTMYVMCHCLGAFFLVATVARHYMDQDDGENAAPMFMPKNSTPTLPSRNHGLQPAKNHDDAGVRPATKTVQGVKNSTKEPDTNDFWNDTSHLESLILQYNLTALEELRDPQFSAYKALQWLGQLADSREGITVDDADEQDDSLQWSDHQKVIEQFVVAVLHFSLHPEGSNPDTKSDSNPSLRRRLESTDASKVAPSSRSKKSVIEGTDWMKDGSICDWRGIRCGREGFVTHVKLPKQHLQGSIPSQICGLKDLLELDLAHNDLSGTIPDMVAELTHLSYLDLQKNKLKGVLPDGLWALTNLHEINVETNELEGTIPSKLEEMTALSYLFLSNNKLESTIPPLTNVPKLIELDLSMNQLEGPLPTSIGDLSQLESLKLHDNKITGTLPTSWSKLSHLESLILHHNDIGGSLPGFLSNMVRLEDVRLNHNMLTGAIPDLQALNRLVHLHLNNNELSGAIDSLDLAVDSLETLLLFENNITGDASSICRKNVSNIQRFAADCKADVECDCCHECF